MKGTNVKYLAIYEELKEEIIDGIYSVGELFPTEVNLQKRFNVSRITIRHAIQLLVSEGYLQRVHGVGTIVLSRKESLQLQTLLSFSEENKNRNIKSTLISFQKDIIANPLVCSLMELPKGALVTMHERLRCIDDVPIGFQRVYSPSFLPLYAEDLEDPNISLYKLFSQKGFYITNATETIESISTTNFLANCLKIPEGSPLLYVQRITKDQKNRIVEYAEFFYPGNKYRYNVQLQVPR